RAQRRRRVRAVRVLPADRRRPLGLLRPAGPRAAVRAGRPGLRGVHRRLHAGRRARRRARCGVLRGDVDPVELVELLGHGTRERLWTARFLTVGFGVAQIAVGIGARNLDGSIVDHVLAVAGYVTGLVLGIFLLGILTQRVGQTAALIGLLAGAALVAGIRF